MIDFENGRGDCDRLLICLKRASLRVKLHFPDTFLAVVICYKLWLIDYVESLFPQVLDHTLDSSRSHPDGEKVDVLESQAGPHSGVPTPKEVGAESEEGTWKPARV